MTAILPMLQHRLIRQGMLLAALVGLCGCNNPQLAVKPSPTTQNATAIDPAQGEPEYWMDQPATASVAHADFDRLWEAADEVSRDLLFKIDRQNRRLGLLTTQPNVAAQFFEPWRREVQTPGELAESSVATIRRTITYKFDKQGDGYVVTPKVLIERQAISERRVSGYLTRAYFRGDRGTAGSREADVGVALQDAYWYPTGRDHALETLLAEKIKAKLRG